MKTNELLQLDLTAMADAIKAMKLKECEKHAKNYAARLKLDYRKALFSAIHAVVRSEQDAPVAQRVATNTWEFVQKSGCTCTSLESEILAMLLLMLIYKQTDEFKNIERVAEIPAGLLKRA